MINVKIDKGVSTMTFAGSGLEIAAEIGVIVHELYTQLYHRAGPTLANGCKGVLLDMLAREGSPVWDANLAKGVGHSFYLDGAAAEAMMERVKRSEGGGSVTRVDLTKAQCADLANYLRGVLNNGMGAGSFDKIEMLVLARRALAAAEELPEASSVAAHAPATRRQQPEDASAASSPASGAAQLKRDTLERLTAFRQKDGLSSLAPLAAACGKVDGKAISAELLARMLNRERFPVAIWREVSAALDKMERKKGAGADGKDD